MTPEIGKVLLAAPYVSFGRRSTDTHLLILHASGILKSSQSVISAEKPEMQAKISVSSLLAFGFFTTICESIHLHVDCL